jgi:hypothetical protein
MNIFMENFALQPTAERSSFYKFYAKAITNRENISLELNQKKPVNIILLISPPNS